MAILFLLLAISIVLMGLGLRTAALIIVLINLFLCLGMFSHHVTTAVNILL